MIKVVKHIAVKSEDIPEGEKLFDQQMSVRANYLLLGDSANVGVPLCGFYVPSGSIIKTSLKWLNRGELIAGSWVTSEVFESKIGYTDIDIYFKSKKDVDDFLKLNGLTARISMNRIAATVETGGEQLNLIWGVHYEDVGDLIYRFDIRACSTALDPNTNSVHYIEGAIHDAFRKLIVYNPLPHNTSLSRLVKYVHKGFSIDAYQRLFLLDLIKTGTVDPAVELTSGYRAVHKV